MMSLFSYSGYSGYRYTMCFERAGKLVSKTFNSRNAANDAMYRLIGKYGLKITKIYDDKHSKTYICNDGVKFYINRY